VLHDLFPGADVSKFVPTELVTVLSGGNGKDGKDGARKVVDIFSKLEQAEGSAKGGGLDKAAEEKDDSSEVDVSQTAWNV
jgi:hypothetical protein